MNPNHKQADGLMSEAVWQAIKSNRWKKSLKWLRHQATQITLPLAAALLAGSVTVMGVFFENSRQGEVSGVAQLLSQEHSPATRFIDMLEEMLHDPNHSRWKVLLGAGEEWTDEMLRWGYGTTVALIGHVFMRLVVPFDRWPWRLFKLVDDEVPEEEKADLEDALDELCGECTPLGDGFTIPFRRQVASKADTRSEKNCSCLKDVRDRAKATNVLTEDRFARVRHELHCNERTSTLATNHFLAEHKALHKIAVDKCPLRPSRLVSQ